MSHKTNKPRVPAGASQRRPKVKTRSVTFRIPDDVYERLEHVAYDELVADVADAETRDLNLSEHLRSLIVNYVEAYELQHRGGEQALRANYRKSQAVELERQLQETLAEN